MEGQIALAMGYYEVEIRGAHREERMLQVWPKRGGLNSPKVMVLVPPLLVLCIY